jgi:two-component system, OmpR family, response regulator
LPHRALKRVLVVDDDPDLLALVSLALTALGGFAVETCGTAADAVDVAHCFGPDLILLDIMMPGQDGFAVLGTIRQIASMNSTPVVFMSAHRLGRQEFARCEALGCLGVIPKPFDPAALSERLEQLWDLNARRRLEAHHSEFEALRRAYMAELAEKVTSMQSAAATLAQAGWDRALVESLYHLAHRMAGSAGLYRLAALSRAAGALEDIVHRLMNGPWPPGQSPAYLERLVQAVARAARSETDVAPVDARETPPRTGARPRIQRA